MRNEIPVVSLTPQQRDAILTVLVNPPAGLRELHSILARDLLERKTP